MEPTQQIADELFKERVLRARATPPAEKLFAGSDLFDYACGITVAGIRAEFPAADEARVQQILTERLALRKRLEDAEWTSRQPS